jgi:hypothetical protein
MYKKYITRVQFSVNVISMFHTNLILDEIFTKIIHCTQYCQSLFGNILVI